MSKNTRKEPGITEEKVCTLRNKLKDRKQQILRLKRTIKRLELKLEKYESGILGTTDKGKPKKKDKIDPIKKSQEARKELRETLKARFSKGSIENG